MKNNQSTATGIYTDQKPVFHAVSAPRLEGNGFSCQGLMMYRSSKKI